ncbi:HAUS augmin-like complex subunit 6 N-terminus-domain-containing protein [Trichoderma asperelloides]|nr:HAUS augmin-like complex subunit 6 N-terminus-domain-containing protein [Trichoderma asperelloides]
MATVVQQTQLLTRTRASRVPSSTARPLRAAAAAAVAAAAFARPPNAGGGIAAAGPASLSLFLTNIKLLSLDQLPDWPGISAETFAPSGTTLQDQKRRVQCVEWALYQLFVIWDPDEAASKLKPFYPPGDQLQSVNLRAALVRALEQAKKNGDLGRDTIIRKTMLDECKGERLEEVLAFFSTAVLKKVVSDSLATSRGYLSPAVELAFENKGYKSEKSHLIALSMAHKASIRQVLRRKEAAKARFKDLAHVLDDKEDDIIRRREALEIKEMDGGGQTVSDNARAEMRRAVHHNWAGSEAWMEALLCGDPKHGGLLATGFDRVWRRAQKGRLNDLDTDDVGLLEQLDNRVKLQKERLHRWDAFRRNTFGEAAPATSKPRTSSAKTKGIDLGFSAHLDLHTVRRVKPTRAALFHHAPQMTDDYAALVSDLKYDLGKIATKEVNIASLTRKRTPRNFPGRSTYDLTQIDDSPLATPPSHTKKPSGYDTPTHRRSPERTKPMSGQKAPHSPPQLSSIKGPEDDDLDPMKGKTPAPMKRTKPRHTLSLAERTRLSMSRKKSLLFEDEELDPPTPISTAPKSTDIKAPEPDYSEDLASRTRRSMAGFEKAQQKAQLERRRSLRRSKMPQRKEGGYFPTVEEDLSEATILLEQLAEEADVEAVFRSRPKVGQSLQPSPTREEWGDIPESQHPSPGKKAGYLEPAERKFLLRGYSHSVTMAYNPYGGTQHRGQPYARYASANRVSAPHNPYGAPPGYGYPGAAPGMAAPPGLGPPPGMSPAPGMAPPPGFQQANVPQANRPSGLPPFQAPTNMPNINFNAPVIRLGTGASAGGGGRSDDRPAQSGGRAGLGMERGSDQGRMAARESMQTLLPPTSDEKLRTIFLHQIPEGLGGDEGTKKLLGAVGKLRRWDPSDSTSEERKGTKFGFALYEDFDSLAAARIESARTALKQVIRELFYPPVVETADTNGDVAMGNTETEENVEVVNIPLAQEDELADIPPEMREVVAGEIAAFRERSNQRDMERLQREEELEEMERRRNGAGRSRLASPPRNSNNVPLGPRGVSVPNAPSGPKGQGGSNRVAFVNGGMNNSDLSIRRDDEDTDASDEELWRRYTAERKAEDDKIYAEAERKWVNRERSRQAALERERERERHDIENLERRKQEQLEREKSWDDEREATRKSHIYYRDRAGWARKRNSDRAEEEARDEADRQAEKVERNREQARLEHARGMADDFLDQQAREMEQREAAAAAAAPQPFKLSLGAAAQRAQASRAAPQRRTIAEVEGLLDDEEVESTRRQLIPIQLDTTSGAAGMSEEEISQAVRALAQEIPSEKDGLWAWEVKWDFMDDAVVRDKLRPFVEKKIVEYLGVQEEMLVEAVEEHLRKHGTAGALVEELEGALDDEAEDLVKKLWRMLIFFTECEKRGLPA